jgi:NADH:ubiquinone oxidoreductase subunit K
MLILGSASVRLITIASLLTFVIQRRHLLICLLALEGVILTLSLILVLQRSEVELFFIFVLVRIGACEARLGLACLVSIIRSYGNDHIKILRRAK